MRRVSTRPVRIALVVTLISLTVVLLSAPARTPQTWPASAAPLDQDVNDRSSESGVDPDTEAQATADVTLTATPTPTPTATLTLTLAPTPPTPTASPTPTGMFHDVQSPTAGPSPTARTGQCAFVAGFAFLHSILQGVDGDCVSNEYLDPVGSGDQHQQTTTGLMVWEKSTNTMRWTDGHRTFTYSKCFLQERLNTQRFAWERQPTLLAGLDASPPPGACSLTSSGAPQPVASSQ